MLSRTILLALVVGLTSATTSPSYSGWKQVWSSEFAGDVNTLPGSDKWAIATGNPGVNGESETYTSSSLNLRLSGQGTLQINPRHNGDTWTSGKITSKHNVSPADGKKTRVEASIRFGTASASNKAGIWPAFWMLGANVNSGVAWPGCGELDIMEQVDGKLVGYGTAHCDVYPGGICNESNGLSQSVQIPNNGYQTWRLQWDRTSSDWTKEVITWSMNGEIYHILTGAQIGSQKVWKSLAANPMFIILNVAVGGSWPGYPNANTGTGVAVGMEVQYVAHYESS